MTFKKLEGFVSWQKGLPARALLRQLQAGQILLIVILAVIVASTIGLSVATRSITSLRTSTEEAESQKALAAAEAGIERAIQGSIPVALPVQIVNNAGGGMNSSYSTTVTQINGSSLRINGGNTIPKDEGADVWFVGHNSDDSLNYSDYSLTSPVAVNLYWGLSDEDCSIANKPAAIQVIIITRAQVFPNEIKSYRYAYDSCSRGNNFSSAGGGATIDGVVFKYGTPANSLASSIPNPKNIILMRVIPIYKDAVIGISATSLPLQGYKIESIGESGQAKSKISVFKGWPQTYLPYLSYGLFVAN